MHVNIISLSQKSIKRTMMMKVAMDHHMRVTNHEFICDVLGVGDNFAVNVEADNEEVADFYICD